MVAAGVIDMLTGSINTPVTCYSLSSGEAIGAVTVITGSPQRAIARAATIAAAAFRLGKDGQAGGLPRRRARPCNRPGAHGEPGDAPDAFASRLRSLVQRLQSAGRAR